MTVKELKLALENMPEDYKVFCFCFIKRDDYEVAGVAGGEASVVERNGLTSDGFVGIWCDD